MHMQIVGSLGCSPIVFECIASINQLTSIMRSRYSNDLPLELASVPERLLEQLEAAHQRPGIAEDTPAGKFVETTTINIAKLYRVAALISLHRYVLLTPTNSPDIKYLVTKGLEDMEQLASHTPPWPLFIVACEVIGDEQRLPILNTLDKMAKGKITQNMVIVRNIVETVWRWIDLNQYQDPTTTRIDWKELIKDRFQIPSFI